MASKFFKKFWTVLDFLQKPLAWFSIFYLHVQSENCGRNSFLIFFSEFFRILSENFFRLSAKNLQKDVKTNFCVSRGTICGLKFFLKVLNRFGFSAETFGLVLKCLSTWPEKKLRKKEFSDFSFQNFFGFWEKNFSDFRPKNFQKVVKTTFCVSRGTIFGLKFFSKVLNRFGFSAETFGMVLKFLYTCPE